MKGKKEKKGTAFNAKHGLRSFIVRCQRGVRALFIAPILFYKRHISPGLPASCRYYPSCSTYMMEAIETRGIIVGLGLGVWRLLRCNPWSRGGYDPVPKGADSYKEE